MTDMVLLRLASAFLMIAFVQVATPQSALVADITGSYMGKMSIDRKKADTLISSKPAGQQNSMNMLLQSVDNVKHASHVILDLRTGGQCTWTEQRPRSRVPIVTPGTWKIKKDVLEVLVGADPKKAMKMRGKISGKTIVVGGNPVGGVQEHQFPGSVINLVFKKQ